MTLFLSIITLFNQAYARLFTSLFTVDSKHLKNSTTDKNQISTKSFSKFVFIARLQNIETTDDVRRAIQQLNYTFNSKIHHLITTSITLATQCLYKAVNGCTGSNNIKHSNNTNNINVLNPLHLQMLNNKWTLSILNNESNNRGLNVNGGLYSMNNYSFRQLTKLATTQSELLNLSTLYSGYIDVARTDRWLYRYSMLHRKSLHKSHNLTSAKQLTSLGFFDASLTSNNLWASNLIKNTADLQSTLSNLHTSLYGDIWHHSATTPYCSNTTTNPLTNLEFFENSYFWAMKRFYLTNTLSNHHTNSNLKTKISINNADLTTNDQNQLLRLNLEDRALFITKPFTRKVAPKYCGPRYFSSKGPNGEFVEVFHTVATVKDTVKPKYLTYDSSTTFLGNGVLRDDNLTALVWIYDDKLNSNLSYNFFNYNAYPSVSHTPLNVSALTTNNITSKQPSLLPIYLNPTRIV